VLIGNHVLSGCVQIGYVWGCGVYVCVCVCVRVCEKVESAGVCMGKVQNVVV